MKFRKNMPTKNTRQSFKVDCTGDACVGDVVLFQQAIFLQNFSKYRKTPAKIDHFRDIIGTIVSDSYGADKQQHTFTIDLIWNSDDGKISKKLKIKGRNLYRNKIYRQKRDENIREDTLTKKHARGDIARQKRNLRIETREY